jgi:hypothetical protein
VATRAPNTLVHVRLIGIAFGAQPECTAEGFEVQTVRDNVVALVGPLGDRTPENLSNNATYGIIVTSDGVVLIGAAVRDG